MTSMQHKFGALDLIRAGLQDLDRARTLFDELHNDGIDDDRMRLLLATLEKACDPDIALSNLVDIIKVMQSYSTRQHCPHEFSFHPGRPK